MTIGETEVIVVPMSNMKVMKDQLRLIYEPTPSGKHAVVVMDQTNLHQSYFT